MLKSKYYDRIFLYSHNVSAFILEGDEFMSVKLLDKTRKINNLLQNNHLSKVIFNDICTVLSSILTANVLVLSKKGKVLGAGIEEGVSQLDELIKFEIGSFVDVDLNERLLNVLSTKENVILDILGFEAENVSDYPALIIPIISSGERLGTLFTYKHSKMYGIEDIILCEYATTVIGLEMLRSVSEEIEGEARKMSVVKSAIGTLSVSEQDAIIYIFDELKENEGIVVASKIADRVGITRSVIVNALRKFESAGVIESHSSGMKGTYIKIINNAIYAEIDKMKQERKLT